MKTLKTVLLAMFGFWLQFIVVVAIGYGVSVPRRLPTPEQAMGVFAVSAITWFVLQIGLLHAKLSRIEEKVNERPYSDPMKW